tara:strand:- start:76 stop:210 length:135 start_codon:yes stop_codon:yes gene_type:complete
MKILGVPILLNTSFNLAGLPIVEGQKALKLTAECSQFKNIYIYL